MPAVKSTRAASLSFCSSSDLAHDLTDDLADVARSSFTQESFRNDSCLRTLSSSPAETPQILMLQHSCGTQETPRDMPQHLYRKASAMTSALKSAGNTSASAVDCERGKGGEVMDAFDLALAIDVQQRRHRHSHPIAIETLPSAATVGEESAADGSRGVSRNYVTDTFCAAPLSPHGTDVLCVASPHSSTTSSRREAQMQHLKLLLRETSSLHEALQRQMEELQHQEEKERKQRRHSPRLYRV